MMCTQPALISISVTSSWAPLKIVKPDKSFRLFTQQESIVIYLACMYFPCEKALYNRTLNAKQKILKIIHRIQVSKYNILINIAHKVRSTLNHEAITDGEPCVICARNFNNLIFSNDIASRHELNVLIAKNNLRKLINFVLSH